MEFRGEETWCCGLGYDIGRAAVHAAWLGELDGGTSRRALKQKWATGTSVYAERFEAS